MTRTFTLFAALSLLAACAQTSSSARVAHAPSGQAAQPGSWSQPAPQIARVSGTPRGQAAQPGSWASNPEPEAAAIYMTGLPAGQAAQPGAWNKTTF